MLSHVLSRSWPFKRSNSCNPERERGDAGLCCLGRAASLPEPSAGQLLNGSHLDGSLAFFPLEAQSHKSAELAVAVSHLMTERPSSIFGWYMMIH